jgi:DNA-binding response OmpR family regulator
MKTRILWIEGNKGESPSFIKEIRKKGYNLEVVPNGSAALTRLTEYKPDLVILNAASLRTTGKRICSSIHEKSEGLPILVISDPKVPADENFANFVLTLPFTIRKLLNEISAIVQPDSKKQLHKGDIHLDLKLRRVRCMGKVTRLTPRLTQILQILMNNAGAVVERNILFREAWDTKYTGDTRTLDVHINWLRKAIEEDPHNPKLLKTLRGVGYRLDV